MFEANHQAIAQKTKEAIELIHKEMETFGSFEYQYEQLENFIIGVFGIKFFVLK